MRGAKGKITCSQTFLSSLRSSRTQRNFCWRRKGEMASAAASTRASSSASTASVDSSLDMKQIWSHEVAIAELKSLPSSRAVYQKKGNVFFRTTIQEATTFEERQLDAAKAKQRKLNNWNAS